METLILNGETGKGHPQDRDPPTHKKQGGERGMGDGCGHSALYETVKKKSSKRNCFKPIGKTKA